MESAVTPVCTVLLIDDEPIIRLGTLAMLEDAGYRVFEAANAEEALVLLFGHKEIKLVITDVQMPGTINGLELVEIIGRNFPSIRSIVTSGKAGLQEARRSGAKGFLPKPYCAETIEAVVRETLAA